MKAVTSNITHLIGKDVTKWTPLDDGELRELCQILNDSESLSLDDQVKSVQLLSYYTVGERTSLEISRLCLDTVDSVLSDDGTTKNAIMQYLITNIQPLLYKPATKTRDARLDKKDTGLNPKLGFSYANEEALEKWRLNGGLNSIPLMYVILRYLERKHVSANIWWITPAILNIIDDTTDLHNIKLQGVMILRTLLEYTFNDGKNDNDSNWITFSQTGLFEIFEPLLINMTYFLPPAYSPKDTSSIFSSIFPTLLALYRTRFDNDSVQYKRHLQKLLSDNILTNILPRIASEHEDLTLIVFDFTKDLIRELQEGITLQLSRFIYTIGEYVVKNPFFTTSMDIVNGTLELLTLVIKILSAERLKAHKYDFIALLVIIFDKNDQEGTLTDELLKELRQTCVFLIDKDCGLDETEKNKLLKSRSNLIKLLN